IIATQNLFDLPDHMRICFVCFASIFVNFGIAVKCLVYYLTSTEYRSAMKQLFGRHNSVAQSLLVSQS
ncbi:hypothetical protein PENTCL1PPCAC_3859, partial [Pristionchus entomophagus]